MDWTKIIEFLGVFGLSATSITLLIGYLGRRYIDFVSTKKIDETRQILINDTEKLKHELSKKANEYQIKINSLHTERLEVLKRFYGLLTVFNDKLFILVLAGKGDEGEISKVKELYSEYYELRTYFKQNKIIINQELSDLINDLITKLHTALFSFNRIIEATTEIKKDIGTRTNDSNKQIRRDYWDKAANLVQNETPVLLDKLEYEFRKIIGVIDK